MRLFRSFIHDVHKKFFFEIVETSAKQMATEELYEKSNSTWFNDWLMMTSFRWVADNARGRERVTTRVDEPHTRYILSLKVLRTNAWNSPQLHSGKAQQGSKRAEWSDDSSLNLSIYQSTRKSSTMSLVSDEISTTHRTLVSRTNCKSNLKFAARGISPSPHERVRLQTTRSTQDNVDSPGYTSFSIFSSRFNSRCMRSWVRAL